ncbi:MAG: hypothetical protein HQ564_09075 [Candidatus Saganbacteria bacterium]|nr:hypothetical protein [Candidatus Saganbacteria bacterium]
MEAGIAVHQQDNYQGGVVRNQIAELLIEHATPSDFNRLSALNWQIEKKLIKRGIIKKSSDFNQDRVAAMIYGGDLKEKEEFVSSITEEDILTDRFNLRKMLAMPYQAIVKVALRIIEKFKAEECFSDLLAAYRGVYQHDRHDPHKWGYQSALYDVATLSDLSDIESMLSDPHKEIRRSGVAIVRKLKAWQLIPKIRPLAKDGDSFAKNALLRFSAEYADWDTVNRFLADNNSYVRQEAREAFAKIADPERNLNLLSAMLKDENKHKRTAAAYALAHLLKDKAEVEIPLPDGTGQVALGYYQARSTPPTISQMLDAARELLGSPKEEVVAPPTSQEDQKEALDLDSITDLLMHKEQSYRIAGVAAAIRLGDASLLPLVKARLSEFEQKTYIDEVKAATRIIMGFVAQHGSRDDLPFIERYMEMPGAIEAFVVHADAREVEKAKSWIKALNTDKERQGKAAIKLLCKLDHREALSDLMLNFENNSSVYNFYTELFGAIVHFEAKEEKPKIIKVLQKESGFYEKDKNAAIEALAALWEEEDLKKYQEAVAEGKIKRTEYTAYFRVLQARAPKIALMLARKKLREIMTGSGYLWNGGLSIEILKELGTREDLPMLFDQLSHPDEKIQKPCAEAVWGIGVRL